MEHYRGDALCGDIKPWDNCALVHPSDGDAVVATPIAQLQRTVRHQQMFTGQKRPRFIQGRIRAIALGAIENGLFRMALLRFSEKVAKSRSPHWVFLNWNVTDTDWARTQTHIVNGMTSLRVRPRTVVPNIHHQRTARI